MKKVIEYFMAKSLEKLNLNDVKYMIKSYMYSNVFRLYQ